MCGSPARQPLAESAARGRWHDDFRSASRPRRVRHAGPRWSRCRGPTVTAFWPMPCSRTRWACRAARCCAAICSTGSTTRCRCARRLRAVAANEVSTSRFDGHLRRSGVGQADALPVHVIVNQTDRADRVLVEMIEIEQQTRVDREERALGLAQANKELVRNLAHEIKNPARRDPRRGAAARDGSRFARAHRVHQRHHPRGRSSAVAG